MLELFAETAPAFVTSDERQAQRTFRRAAKERGVKGRVRNEVVGLPKNRWLSGAQFKRLAVFLVLGFVAGFLACVGVSLVFDGDVPWRTEGAVHEVSVYTFYGVYLLACLMFALGAGRKR